MMVTEDDGSEHDYQFDFDSVSGRYEFSERDLLERDFGEEWVEKMEEIGMQHVYAEIPGGDHSLVISQNREHMQKFIDFFNIVRKQY